MSTLWAWYRAALKNPAAIGTDALPIHENDPQHGYYRMRRGGGKGPWEPVYIDAVGSPAMAKIGPWATAEQVQAVEIWKWCCRNPVHHQFVEGRPETAVNYTDVAVHMKPWPDSVFSMVERKPDPEPEPAAEGDAEAPGLGHNSGEDAQDILTKLTEDADRMLAAANADLEKLGPVSLDKWAKSDADRIANRANEIAAIEKKITIARDDEVSPLRAIWLAAVDKWKPLQTRVDTTKTKLNKSATDWAAAAQKKANEEAKARAAAEAERLAAERAKLSASTQETLPAAPAPIVQAERVLVGTVGRRQSAKVTTRYVIEDRKAAMDYVLANVLDSAPIIEALQKTVDRICNAGTSVPGVRKVVE